MTAHKSARDTTHEGEGSGAAFALFAERLKDARQGVESLVDPFGIVSPFVHEHVAWGLHPMEYAELAMRYAADLSALQLNVGAKLVGRKAPDAVRPLPDDQRFSDPVWTKEPGWDALKQAPGLSFR
jgi:poly[(R)-3-hydroxyalkanoate] polymerase subunit PhaC